MALTPKSLSLHLQQACKDGDETKLRSLHEEFDIHGSDLTSFYYDQERCNPKITPPLDLLEIAIVHSHVHIVKFILTFYKPNLSQSIPIDALARKSNSQILDLMYKHDADFPKAEYGDYTSLLGRSLHYPDAVFTRWLLDHGADPEHSIGPLQTPLWITINKMNCEECPRGIEIVQCLLRNGAVIKELNVKQAIEGQRKECLKAFLVFQKQVLNLNPATIKTAASLQRNEELSAIVDELIERQREFTQSIISSREPLWKKLARRWLG